MNALATSKMSNHSNRDTEKGHMADYFLHEMMRENLDIDSGTVTWMDS